MSGQCPNCGFSYGWDGKECSRCNEDDTAGQGSLLQSSKEADTAGQSWLHRWRFVVLLGLVLYWSSSLSIGIAVRGGYWEGPPKVRHPDDVKNLNGHQQEAQLAFDRRKAFDKIGESAWWMFGAPILAILASISTERH